MSPAPSVRCSGCGFSWNSAAMADGLRLLGSCPKCSSADLVFRDDDGDRGARFHPAPLAPITPAAAAPHLVLGIPRR